MYVYSFRPRRMMEKKRKCLQDKGSEPQIFAVGDYSRPIGRELSRTEAIALVVVMVERAAGSRDGMVGLGMASDNGCTVRVSSRRKTLGLLQVGQSHA